MTQQSGRKEQNIGISTDVMSKRIIIVSVVAVIGMVLLTSLNEFL